VVTDEAWALPVSPWKNGITARFDAAGTLVELINGNSRIGGATTAAAVSHRATVARPTRPILSSAAIAGTFTAVSPPKRQSRRPSKATNALTREEWRELGFFYDMNKEQRFWRVRGSVQGLLGLCRMLRDYARDERNFHLSEHEHYGPYMYLELMTWTEPKFDHHAWSGRLEDFVRLATVIEGKLAGARPEDVFIIDAEYSDRNEYTLRIEVADDAFDPASADPYCQDPANA
jgi:hypothetical protein